jgi:hypothetical protein
MAGKYRSGGPSEGIMPQKHLVVTVGGSHEPVRKSIETHNPDFTVFLCSDDRDRVKGSYVQVVGEGNVNSSRHGNPPDLPSIVAMLQLPCEKYEIRKITEFDSLYACYEAARNAISGLMQKNSNARILVDYTGGTKSMTAGLAAAGLDEPNCELFLVSGTRTDRIKVQGTDHYTRALNVFDLRGKRSVDEALKLIKKYDYSGAVSVFEKVAATSVSDEFQGKLQKLVAWFKAFDFWDRFDLMNARNTAEPLRRYCVEHCKYLDKLNTEEDLYLKAEDLLFNAERRAVAGRYDDAVARLYRAAEMIAQIRLQKRHGVDSGDVKIIIQSEDTKRFLEQHKGSDGKIRVPLFAGWKLLLMLDDKPLGEWFSRNEGRLQDFLATRNSSILAHGMTPVDAATYQNKGAAFLQLCRDALSLLADERSKTATLALQLPNAPPREFLD